MITRLKRKPNEYRKGKYILPASPALLFTPLTPFVIEQSTFTPNNYGGGSHYYKCKADRTCPRCGRFYIQEHTSPYTTDAWKLEAKSLTPQQVVKSLFDFGADMIRALDTYCEYNEAEYIVSNKERIIAAYENSPYEYYAFENRFSWSCHCRERHEDLAAWWMTYAK